MAGCFDFRSRTSSFDLHQLAQKRKLISKMFRSQSVQSVAKAGSPKSSPKTSPKGSPTSAVSRRRFLRVVKDAEAHGEEYDNPHLIRHYTQQYVKEQWSSQRAGSPSSFDENLPYTVSGHTILKKPSSLDSPCSGTGGSASPTADIIRSSSPTVHNKHASFKEEVQVIEFDKKSKIVDDKKCHRLNKRTEKLQDSDDDEFYCSQGDVCEVCQSKGRSECPHLSSDSEVSDIGCDAVDAVSMNMITRDTVVTTTNTVDTETTTTSESAPTTTTSLELSVTVRQEEILSRHTKESSPDSIVEKLVNVHTDFSSSQSTVHTP